MRVILVAVGSRGDAVPFVALARRLVDRGHDVALVTHSVYAPPSADGLHVVGVDSDPADVLSGPAATALRRFDVRGLNRTRGVFADFVASVAGPVEGLLAGADVVVASTFATAAVAVAREAGVPVVRVQLWPELADLAGPMPLAPYSWAVPWWARRSARAALRGVEPLLAGFDGWWEHGRLRIVPDYDAGFTTNDLGVLHAYSPRLLPPGIAGVAGGRGATSLGRRTTATREVVTGWWWDASGELSEGTSRLLDQPGSWVYVGFGSMYQDRPDKLVRLVEAACAPLGVRAVVQIAGADVVTATPMPGSVVHPIGAEPHAALFSRVHAAVHHGGAGTTSALARAGVPSVVVPHVADQFYWAHRLHTSGVAARPLPRPLLTASRLRRRLARALDPVMAGAARDLAARVADEDGTGAAVRYLEAVVAAPASRPRMSSVGPRPAGSSSRR